MGKCLFMRKGEVHSEPFAVDPVFANNDWSKIIEACQKNKVPDTWAVGSQKPMTINGTSYQIDIIGINHDSYSDGSGIAPITFQMHDCYDTTYQMNSTNTNLNGWTSCAMRLEHLPALLTKMPTEVQSAIKEVNKLTSAGNKSSTINTTADKLFLLSEIEVFGAVSVSYAGEGSQYAYYAAGNTKAKTRSGRVDQWWERSPCVGNVNSFCCVNSSGDMNGNSANSSYGVSYAFCF